MRRAAPVTSAPPRRCEYAAMIPRFRHAGPLRPVMEMVRAGKR